MIRALAFLLALAAAPLQAAEPKLLLMPTDSPLVTLRLVFRTGAAFDPEGKEGAAALTAAMLSRGGSAELPYDQIVEKLFPLAASVNAQVDKETVVFHGTTHVDNLEAYYETLRSMLLEPGWREDDFRRLKDEALNFLRIELRSNNEEELGKEFLYLQIYPDAHPYGHHNVGTIESLEALTLDDLKAFYQENFRRGNLTIGLAGGYPGGFAETVAQDFMALADGAPPAPELPASEPVQGLRVHLVQKETRSTLISLGFPLEVTRAHPDWPALKLVQSYFGQHRSSKSYLYQRIREIRGLNYGDYAYIEYFPSGMYQFRPDPNRARRQQIFQIWIRPVQPQNGPFTLKIALYELDKLVRDGLSEEDLESTRLFLSKYVNLLTQTQEEQLGYALDSEFYGVGPFNSWFKERLQGLTLEEVNSAIRRHLRPSNLDVVVITADAAGFQRALESSRLPSLEYASPPPQAILEEDKLIARYKLDVGDIGVTPAEQIFED